MIKGSLLLSVPIVKHFVGLILNLFYNLVFWAIARKNPSTGLTCGRASEKK